VRDAVLDAAGNAWQGARSATVDVMNYQYGEQVSFLWCMCVWGGGRHISPLRRVLNAAVLCHSLSCSCCMPRCICCLAVVMAFAAVPAGGVTVRQGLGDITGWECLLSIWTVDVMNYQYGEQVGLL
jgi:hypothetical protein